MGLDSVNKNMPTKGYKTYAILGLFIETLFLALHNPFFSILIANNPTEELFYMTYIPLKIFCIAGCILLLSKKLIGLYFARISLILNLFISILELVLGVAYVDSIDYLIGIMTILIYGLVLKYWLKKDHLKFLAP
tara:strand:+ start:353 stop:757 length:405 start_codon:yes stop_codon:yes gene_type:complete